MATVRDYFETDFRTEVTVNNTFFFDWGPNGQRISIDARLHLDFDANATFLSLYAPAVSDPAELICGVCAHLDRIHGRLSEGDVSAGSDGEIPAKSKDLHFAGRVFVYGEDEMAAEEVIKVAELLRGNGLYFRYRGPGYAHARSIKERPLAFISFDSSDRTEVAQPLALALAGIRCPAWFDEYQIRAGDDLERSILTGLDACERCIVVLSPRYLENQRWAKREFEAVASREAREQRALIIPLYHGVEREDVARFSQVLAGRKELRWDRACANEIASELSITLLSVGRDHERHARDGPDTPGAADR